MYALVFRENCFNHKLYICHIFDALLKKIKIRNKYTGVYISGRPWLATMDSHLIAVMYLLRSVIIYWSSASGAT